ncbi:hypothetical protein [Kibdelosporangium aridum]
MVKLRFVVHAAGWQRAWCTDAEMIHGASSVTSTVGRAEPSSHPQV